MPDLAVNPASLPDYNRTMGKITPIYLVSLEGGKKETYFVATKFDDSYNHCAKFIGFYCNLSIDMIVSSYEEVIKTTDGVNFVEILIPWHKINSIRSLVYKHKTIGEKK